MFPLILLICIIEYFCFFCKEEPQASANQTIPNVTLPDGNSWLNTQIRMYDTISTDCDCPKYCHNVTFTLTLLLLH